MGKLKTLPSRLGKLAPALGYMDTPARTAEVSRSFFAPWRKWYGTARWREMRLRIFARDGFTCQHRGCGFMTADTSKLVCDHRQPHRGDERLFWDEGNLQTLCKPHHDREKQREERGGRAG
jgi:5-methylcytosine-specific restriction enzyme A